MAFSNQDRFKFVKQYTAVGQKNAYGEITADEIQAMTGQEFLQYQNRLVDVRRRKRRDTQMWEKNTAITTAMKANFFRKSINEQETYPTSANTYIKTRAHTNMAGRAGNFGQGDLVIITGIEAAVASYALVATAYSGGAVTNPLGVTALTLYDPALLEAVIVNQYELAFFRGETLIVDGLVKDFPQSTGISGVVGAAVGGVFQNALFNNSFLDNPQVLQDDEDWHIEIAPLSAIDLTSATGLNAPVVIQVELSTIELRRVFP
jgi:hypothetical protein